jgi:hypothetical protein
MADNIPRIDQSDAEAFSAKLHAWGETLNAKERAFLHVLVKAAEESLPARSELSDQELEGVAGGAGVPLTLGTRAFSVFSRFIGRGGLAAGGEITEGEPTILSSAPRF